MRSLMWISAVAMLAACNGSDPKDDTGDTNTGDKFSEYINITDESVGDFTCFSSDGWLTQSVDSTKQVALTGVTAIVSDFESGDEVADAKVDIFTSDTVSSSPDFSATSDSNGAFTFTATACTPATYKVWTDPELDATVDTYEAHQVWTPDASDEEFNSVSTTTFAIIPSLLGVTVNPGQSVVAGTAFDCNGDPIEGAQVVMKDASGNIPDELVVKYFVNEFPNRNQPYTSEDGLWVAINIPEGEVTVELWAIVGGELTQVGGTKMQSFADSINISNIYTGYGDGVYYPDACLTE